MTSPAFLHRYCRDHDPIAAPVGFAAGWMAAEVDGS